MMQIYKELREENIKFVVENWNKMTKREMAEKLGVTENTIHSWKNSFVRENGGVDK